MGVISLTKDWSHVGKQRHLSAPCIAAILIIGIQVNNDSNACCWQIPKVDEYLLDYLLFLHQMLAEQWHLVQVPASAHRLGSEIKAFWLMLVASPSDIYMNDPSDCTQPMHDYHGHDQDACCSCLVQFGFPPSLLILMSMSVCLFSFHFGCFHHKHHGHFFWNYKPKTEIQTR